MSLPIVLLGLAGLVITLGVLLIYVPAGLIVLGLILAAAGVLQLDLPERKASGSGRGLA